MLLYCNVNEISRLTLKLAYAGAQDGQTIRVSVANREVFVTFRVRKKKKHFFLSISSFCGQTPLVVRSANNLYRVVGS